MTRAEGIRRHLSEANPEAVLFDDCDEALAGVAAQQLKSPLACYDYDRLVEVFEAQGMSHEEAGEWVDFNVVNVWAGEHTPMIGNFYLPPIA